MYLFILFFLFVWHVAFNFFIFFEAFHRLLFYLLSRFIDYLTTCYLISWITFLHLLDISKERINLSFNATGRIVILEMQVHSN